jgi:hypothetical protein
MSNILNNRRLRIGIGILGFAAAVFAAQSGTALPQGPTQAHSSNGSITLARPAFLRVAHAEGDATAAFVDEAGISAYLNLGQALNLNTVDDVCRTVEASTSSYFQCSVGVTGYDESQDVKVYVEQSGWVLAYYPRGEATGRVFDWKGYDGGTAIPTKLEKAIERVVQKAGLAGGTPTYYHFAYPNANRLLLIADKTIGTDDAFQVNLPGSYSYFERSWAFRVDSGCNTDYFLNGQSIFRGNSGYPAGLLTPSQLPVDTLHTISVNPGCGNNTFIGLALIYRVP